MTIGFYSVHYNVDYGDYNVIPQKTPLQYPPYEVKELSLKPHILYVIIHTSSPNCALKSAQRKFDDFLSNKNYWLDELGKVKL